MYYIFNQKRKQNIIKVKDGDTVNSRQIILELESDTIYKPSMITSRLLDLFPELGNEVILPIDMSNDNSVKIPIFFFRQNETFNISGNFYNIVINVSDNYIDEISNIIKNVFRIFSELKISFTGLAYTYEEERNKTEITKLKDKYLKSYDTKETDELFLNFIRYFQYQGYMVRWLEGYSTLNDAFIRHYEFNTKVTKDSKVSYKDFCTLYQHFNQIIKDTNF